MPVSITTNLDSTRLAVRRRSFRLFLRDRATNLLKGALSLTDVTIDLPDFRKDVRNAPQKRQSRDSTQTLNKDAQVIDEVRHTALSTAPGPALSPVQPLHFFHQKAKMRGLTYYRVK